MVSTANGARDVSSVTEQLRPRLLQWGSIYGYDQVFRGTDERREELWQSEFS
jgi:hypothetical protein